MVVVVDRVAADVAVFTAGKLWINMTKEETFSAAATATSHAVAVHVLRVTCVCPADSISRRCFTDTVWLLVSIETVALATTQIYFTVKCCMHDLIALVSFFRNLYKKCFMD